MMRFCASPPKFRDKIFLSWGRPSFWLSRLLVSLYAQKNVTRCSYFCWKLAFSQIVWDEVRGKFPLVHEEVFSETSLVVLLYFTRGICLFTWCVGAGVRPRSSVSERRTDNKSVAHSRVYGLQGSMADQIALMFVFSIRPYWPNMVVLDRMQCLMDDVVNSIYECIISSFIICNLCFLRNSEQHLRVLGLCLVALDVHHRMLGPPNQGCCFYRFFVPLLSHLNMSVVWTIVHLCCVIGPCLRALEWHLRMLGYACKGISDTRWLDSFFFSLF